MHRAPRRPPWTWVSRGATGATVAIALGAMLVPGCGDETAADCPEKTEPLTAAELDIYRQLEVCASRVNDMTLHRDDPPEVESDPELVQCDQTAAKNCVATPAGEPVAGFYLEGCDTFTVGDRSILLHEMLHPVLCGVPDLDCDPGHTNKAWGECQKFKGCPDGRIILVELVCDGKDDCAEGEDERGCD